MDFTLQRTPGESAEATEPGSDVSGRVHVLRRKTDTLSTPQAFRNSPGQQNGPVNNYDEDWIAAEQPLTPGTVSS